MNLIQYKDIKAVEVASDASSVRELTFYFRDGIKLGKSYNPGKKDKVKIDLEPSDRIVGFYGY